jgi:ribosome-associated translation inhibitor RaiA
MQVQVNCGDGLQAKETLERWANDYLNESLSRFRDELTRVEVQLSDDAKGKHGAQDLRCTLEARLAAHQPVVASHFGETMDEAIRGATQKLIKGLDHTFGKLDRHQHRDRDTIRRDPDVVEQDNS